MQGLHTTLGNYEIFTSDLETMDEILTTKDNSIIDNPNFKDSIAAIPLPNQGYIYLDWTKSQNLLDRQVPILKLVEVLGKPFFNNLRSPQLVVMELTRDRLKVAFFSKSIIREIFTEV